MRALTSALLGVAVATAPALAQRAPKYDPTAEVTVTGVVVDTHEAKERNDHPGLHFILQIGPAPEDVPAVAEGGPPQSPSAEEPAAGEPEVAPEPAAAAAAAEPDVAAAEPDIAAAAEPDTAAAAEPEPPPAPAETVEVHACPLDLLGYLDFTVEKGDELTVTGSRPGDGSIIVARELVKGVVKLQVRDAKGVPIWEDLP